MADLTETLEADVTRKVAAMPGAELAEGLRRLAADIRTDDSLMGMLAAVVVTEAARRLEVTPDG